MSSLSEQWTNRASKAVEKWKPVSEEIHRRVEYIKALEVNNG